MGPEQSHITSISITFCPPLLETNGWPRLGAAQEWPKVPALLLLDSLEAAAHQQLWLTVAAHEAPVWVLLQDRHTGAQLGTVVMLRRLLLARALR